MVLLQYMVDLFFKRIIMRTYGLRGFTLVELAVCIAIIVIITSVVLVSYPEGSVKITLANLNNKIALLFREAQVRGSAIDSGNINQGAESPIGGYGIFMSLSAPNSVVLFADSIDTLEPKPYGLSVGNSLYQITPIDETYSTTIFPSGYVIAKLCVGSGYPYTCNTALTPALTSLTISFTRPSPQPTIYVNGNRSTVYSSACAELRSPRYPGTGHMRSVQIYGSGMIRTGLGPCD